MIIGGFQKISLSDFPGRVSAIVFTRGCGFRCPYCHNPELVDPDSYVAPLDEAKILSFLRSRRGRIQGVVITGGEPTFHDDLPDFIRKVREIGCEVKLDTNGSNPALLERIISLGLVDYVALDVKAPLRLYSSVARVPVNTGDILRSIRLVIDSGLPHEMRTTYLESLLSLNDMREIGEMVKGCRLLFVQSFRPTKALDPAMLEQPRPPAHVMEEIRAAIDAMGVPCETR
ncbi:MAG: anaerobic ribonucleoside-triphosphate reductase activating protein [Spirochaetes bacterium]|nr:anaerobic ribonucleoside-triphosphate reductase activating protein [Spirochaetota bacterium]